MPELPEVQTVVNYLAKLILNKKIKLVNVFYPKVLKNVNEDNFKKILNEQSICDIQRKGKNILFILNDYIVVSHLRMEGKYFYNLDNNTKDFDKHNRHIMFQFNFSDGSKLQYSDTRRFGTIHVYPFTTDYNDLTHLNKLGLEPWDKNLTVKYLNERAINRRINIKFFLLDQSNITGIGNIYADEILYLAKILPTRNIKNISDNDFENIIKFTRIILKEAIEKGGTTIFSFSHGAGIDGKFQQNLNVYGRKNLKCNRCHHEIIKIKLNQRGTHYCSKCQK